MTPPRGAGGLPPVFVAEIVGLDESGMPHAAPARWTGAGAPPRFPVAEPRRGRPRAPGVGDRVLVRRHAGESVEIIHNMGAARPRRAVGVWEPGRDGGGGLVRPAERGRRSAIRIAPGADDGARPGDLVAVELPGGAPPGRVAEIIGAPGKPGVLSRLVLERSGAPRVFPPEALAEAESARPAAPEGREDLRDLPFVTIDDEDARDFDDAVWAEPAREGWRVIVAIADVAHYVRPGSALDREARRRGNSIYLPDGVTPMLPAALSNELCSLRPGAERPCLAAHLCIGPDGALLRRRFARAAMRSAARLTYRETQERGPGDPALAALFGAYAALRRAREARRALDFDLPERRVLFDAAGAPRAIEPRPRYDSHRLIEEFMIAANVAAAETLAERGASLLYRVHDRPPPDKAESLRSLLASLGWPPPPREPLTAERIDAIVRRARGRPEEDAVAAALLRAQSRAEYSPRNIGHFGLGLRRYAHFTSPIRRYADLVVHRALIAALGLGAGGAPAGAAPALAELGAALSDAERRAAHAERDALDRFAAQLLAGRIGETFDARIVGVARFGAFAALAGTGAEGLIPARAFGERMRFDAARARLVDRRSGAEIGVGAPLRARLAEADPIAGTLRLDLENPQAPWR